MQLQSNRFFLRSAVLCCLLQFISFCSPGQRSYNDSLANLISHEPDDTNKVVHLNTLAWSVSSVSSDSALALSTEALRVSENLASQSGAERGSQPWLKIQKCLYQSYYQVASFNDDKADYARAFAGYQKALDVCSFIESAAPGVSRFVVLDRKARVLGAIGLVHLHEGNVDKALDYLIKGLKFSEEEERSGNPDYASSGKNISASWLGNIGTIYYGQKNMKLALEYYFKALKSYNELGFKPQIATWTGNIGLAYADMGDYEKAQHYYDLAVKMNTERGALRSLASNYGNLATMYRYRKDYDKSREYYEKDLALREQSGDRREMATVCNNIGALYVEMMKNAGTGQKPVFSGKAEKYLLRATALSDSIGDYSAAVDENYNLADLYETRGDYKKALTYYRSSVAAKDSLLNEARDKEMTRKVMNYEFDKKEAAQKAEQDKKDALAGAEKKRQNIIILSVGLVLLLVIVIAVVIARSLRTTRKQKELIEMQKEQVDIANNELNKRNSEISEQRDEIELQKELVEEKQKEIIDSITYAKRLQHAILPPAELVKNHLPDNFILYIPKDIVAGDFYWMEHRDGITFIAAADSTGHGVPGAMVSIVCSNALNRAVKEFGLSTTGAILDKTRELVVETFEKSSDEVKDGMDISLLAIDVMKNQVMWSGANNPLWFIQDGNFHEIKADKQPIGRTDHAQPFTTHELTLKSDSIFYLMTDGFADQFGGPNGKKFKYNQLRELMESSGGRTMSEQKDVLQEAFHAWKGTLEQIDDVTIVGIHLASDQ